MRYLYVVYTPRYSYARPKGPTNQLSRHRKYEVAKRKAIKLGANAEIWREWSVKRGNGYSIFFEPYRYVELVKGKSKLRIRNRDGQVILRFCGTSTGNALKVGLAFVDHALEEAGKPKED